MLSKVGMYRISLIPVDLDYETQCGVGMCRVKGFQLYV